MQVGGATGGGAGSCYSVLSSRFAQSDQGKFSGIIRDAQNAFVPGVTVTVTNERTGESRTTVSNAKGVVFVGGLKPSTYTIRVQLVGIRPIEYTNMLLAVGQELALDFELKTAGVQEAVTVVGTSPVLDLSSAKVGANVSEREVQGLPVNGRQMSQLMLQAPGSQNAGDGTWQDISFSGRATNQNVVKYDGVEGSAIIDASPGNVNGENRTPFRLQASLENVQEFRVESSNYPAEHGTGTGGQVSVITKSGGNSFHGAMFEYLRDDALDARNHFDSFRAVDDSVVSEGPKSKLSQHQFGGSIGGPIVKDRAFFFGSYEGYHLDAGQNIIEAVPSDLAWSRAVPAIQATRPAFTSGGAAVLPGASTDPLIDIVQLQDDQKVREHAFSGRFDLRMNQSWSFYTRVFHDQGTNDQPDGVTGRRKHFTDNPTNAVFNLQGLLGGWDDQRVQVRLQRGTQHLRWHDDGHCVREFSDFVLRNGGEQRNLRSGWNVVMRNRWRARSCQQPGKRRQRPVRSLFIDLRRFADPCSGQSLLQVRRRRPPYPNEHGSTGRHHVHLQQHQLVHQQHSDEHSIYRGSQRAEPVQ